MNVERTSRPSAFFATNSTMADAISIEETNRLRISLGMKPLPVPGAAPAGPVFKEPSASTEEAASTLESRQAEGYDNYRKLKEAEEAKRKRDAKTEAIKKARDAAKRFAKLEGKGLGDADKDADMDARSWLIKSHKRRKEIEKARKLEQERMEEEARLAAEYTAKDLAGVKVGHEFDSLVDGEEQVLTLKDTTIEENEEEGDELENLDLREREKLNENLELKKKKPVYNPNDDDDVSGSILAHYDEVIDEKKNQKRFTLDGLGSTTEMQDAVANGTATQVKTAISLDILEDEPKSDYLGVSEIKIKKSKKSKKSKSTRQKAADDDDIFPILADGSIDADAMDVDQPVMPTKKPSYEDAALGDDDDLQASLAAQRRAALKKRKKFTPEDMARRLREEASTIPAAEDENPENDGGLVIDETTEFVANLRIPVAPERKAAAFSTPKFEGITAMNQDSDDEDGDVHMSYANVEDEEDLKERLQGDIGNNTENSIPTSGIEEEATLDNGIGSTLKLLKDRGIIKTADSGDLNAIYRDRQRFLSERQRREAAAELKARQQRERDRVSGRLDRMSAREKEEYARQQNNYRDQQESRQLAEHFSKEYKPNVELKYIDEHGRSMDQKEAFKHLSHQFHGKGSGKQKTEKKLKKIEEQKRVEAKSTLDSSGFGGMNAAVGAQTKKRGQAGVRLA